MRMPASKYASCKPGLGKSLLKTRLAQLDQVCDSSTPRSYYDRDIIGQHGRSLLGI
jgi:hypothetical protein